MIGAYGRRSLLDKHLSRPFAGIRTGFTGVTFHVPAEMLGCLRREEIVIALGRGMYCGLVHVGGGTATICFLEQRGEGDIPSRRRVGELARSNYAFSRVVTPEVLAYLLKAPVLGTGNVFFGPRSTLEQGVLMVGDSAGVIAPLSGDGIGIAMQQGQLLGRLFAENRTDSGTRGRLHEAYQRESADLFSRRKRFAGFCQHVALSQMVRPLLTPLLSSAPGLLQAAISATRGSVA